MKHYAKHLGLCALLGSLTFISGSAFAEEAVNLWGSQEAELGRITIETGDNTMSDGTMAITLGDMSMESRLEMTESTVIRSEALAGGKIKRIITKDMSKMSSTSPSGTERFDEENPLVGIPLIGEQKNGKWAFSLESGKPTEEQQTSLDEQAVNEEIKAEIYQGRVVKIDESWALSPKAMEHLMGDGVTNVKGTATMTLKRIGQYNGQRCAVLELNYNATATMVDDGSQATMIMKGTVYRSLEMFEDIKADFTGSMGIALSDPKNGMSMVIKGPLKAASTVTFE